MKDQLGTAVVARLGINTTNELVRYCPECGTIGPVPPGKESCCPDSFGMSMRRWQAEKMERVLDDARGQRRALSAPAGQRQTGLTDAIEQAPWPEVDTVDSGDAAWDRACRQGQQMMLDACRRAGLAALVAQVAATDVDALTERLVRAAWEWGKDCEVDSVRWGERGDSHNEWQRSTVESHRRDLSNVFAARAVLAAAGPADGPDLIYPAALYQFPAEMGASVTRVRAAGPAEQLNPVAWGPAAILDTPTDDASQEWINVSRHGGGSWNVPLYASLPSPQPLRMLTEAELGEVFNSVTFSRGDHVADAVQRKFIEVNGLPIPPAPPASIPEKN